MKIRKIKEIEDSIKILKSLREYYGYGDTFGGSKSSIEGLGGFLPDLNTSIRNRKDSSTSTSTSKDTNQIDPETLTKLFDEKKENLLEYANKLTKDPKIMLLIANFISKNPNPFIYFKRPNSKMDMETALGTFKKSLQNNGVDENKIKDLKDVHSIPKVLEDFINSNPEKFLDSYKTSFGDSRVDIKNIFSYMIQNAKGRIKNYQKAYNDLYSMYIKQNPPN